MAHPEGLTSAETAARLGIKRETLYAYVSRGMLSRHLARDGRTSIFDAAEVDAFRNARRRHAPGEVASVISTRITRISDGSLAIRGQDLVSFIEQEKSFEDVVDLLFDMAGAPWPSASEVPDALGPVQDHMPTGASYLERLRVAAAVVSASDPLRFDSSPRSVALVCRRLLTAFVVSLPRVGKPVGDDVPLCARLWPALTARRATRARVRALDVALALLVDHGLASSTFGARVAASVRADPYSITAAGMGVIGGRLHGAASVSVHKLFDDVQRGGDLARAVGDSLRRSPVTPGFGHPVYETDDPRCRCLLDALMAGWAGDRRLETVLGVRELIARRSGEVANVDLALGALTWLAEMEPEAGEAIFAIARTSGWLAHGLEEYDEPPLRFRARARFIS